MISGLTLWSDTYDIDQQDMAEMISVQGDIARNVAVALKNEIPGTETVDFETLPAELLKAHRFNLAARNAQTHQKYAEAWRLAQKAIALAPDFYEALDTFTTVNLLLVATPLPGMSSRVHADLALEHANRMIALAAERSEGHALRAATLAAGKDWSGAAAAIEVLADMNAPLSRLDAIGLVLLARGDFERAVAIYEANLITDLINPYTRGLLMAAYELAGRRGTAQARYEMGQELHHQWFGDTVNVLLALGRGQNLSDIEQVSAISDQLRKVLEQSANPAAVRAALDAYRATPVTNSMETLYYAALAASVGEHDSAVDLLRIATQEVASGIFWVWLPAFDATRRQPSFRQLLHNAGLVAYWQSHGWPRMCQPDGADFSCDWRAHTPDLSLRQ